MICSLVRVVQYWCDQVCTAMSSPLRAKAVVKRSGDSMILVPIMKWVATWPWSNRKS